MVTVDKAVFARLNKKGKEFEILVDPDTAQKAKEDLKKGNSVDVRSILAVDDIFTDSKKGIRASGKDLQAAFNTDDRIEAAKIIIREGKIYTTGAQRDKERQDKWERLVALISINAVDARTKIPIPRKTIEDSLKHVVYRVDERKVEDQLPDAIKALRTVLPLSFEKKTIQLENIAPNIAGGCMNICKSLGAVTKQNWNQDRSLTVVVEIPVGLKDEFIDKINALTRGQTEMKILD